MDSYWKVVWKQYRKSKIALLALGFFILFCLIGLYAPLFASSKPLLVLWDGTYYWPLLRYLFYAGFYTKPIDLFFNLLMFTLPVAVLGAWLFKKSRLVFLSVMALIHCVLFGWILSGPIKNPADDSSLSEARGQGSKDSARYFEDPLLALSLPPMPWSFDLSYLSDYGKLNLLLDYQKMQKQQNKLKNASLHYLERTGREMPTLWHVWQRNSLEKETQLKNVLEQDKEKYASAQAQLAELIDAYRPFSHTFIMAKYALKQNEATTDKEQSKKTLTEIVNQSASYRKPLAHARMVISNYEKAKADLNYLLDKKQWLEKESTKLWVLPSLLRPFHWEEDAGGAQEANQYVPWWELTRINRKDLVSSLLFGIRVSLVVGTLAVFLSLLIGLPLGIVAGYFAKKTDLVICRILEMWEAMPTFFMLLLVIAITQSKSIFLVICVLGIFGWTGFSRFIRSEVLKQRKLPYVDACRSLGFGHPRIMFSHILPNAIPPILTLLPFAMMAAITSESALSFLGLGEEGSSSWGVLMGEGRSVFPAESYLLWPPAILLTVLLVSIAIIGDGIRDAMDPKMR